MTVPKNGRPRSTPKRHSERRLRLVKVMVQPVFALDDGQALKELVADVAVVDAAAWEQWSKTAFSEESLEQLLGQVVPQLLSQAPPVEAPPA